MVTSNLEYLMFLHVTNETENLIALKILHEEHFEHSKLEAFGPTRN